MRDTDQRIDYERGEGIRACHSGKIGYARRRDAVKWLRRIQSKPGSTARRVYQCAECGQYHVTSQEKR